MKRFVVLGDTHFPFHSKWALDAAFEIIKREKPDYVIQVGDLYDLYSLSKFPRNVNVMTPKDEITLARGTAEEMWEYIQRISPKSQCIQLLGNHCERLQKRITEKLPEILGIVLYRQLFQFENVKTYLDTRDEVVIEKIAFMHGYRTKLGDHCKYNMMNTVCGHTHRGGVFFTQVNNRQIWELNAGYLADPLEAAMSYTRQKWVQWTLGVGIIDDYGPRFVPLTT